MTMLSIKWAGAISLAAMLTLGTSLPAAAQGQVQAVPRIGLTFSSTLTVPATIESVDTESRTVAFIGPDGRLIDVPVGDGVKNLDSVADGSAADVTYNQIVTILNLRQKGPGSKLARGESMNPATAADNQAGRFTLTISAIDLAKNTVSVVNGVGGSVQTYAANTPAKQELLKKAKVGDVVIGLTTPLLVTAIKPTK
jgi:hypothetical protein